MRRKYVSIIIPTLNEAGNIGKLVNRIHVAMTSAGMKYELVFIDDNSQDKTVDIIQSLMHRYPISVTNKKNDPGKAQSLIEGFERAKYSILCMIDADLQYPPEKIPVMVNMIGQKTDIVVAQRKNLKTSFLRQLASRTFMYAFGRILHGLNCDVQSGLKVFRKEIFAAIEVKPSPWTFDLEFLVKAQNAGYKITNVPITFNSRKLGKTKVNIIRASMEIGLNAVKLKGELLFQSLTYRLSRLSDITT